MAEFPAMPLWTDAYLGDTTHLTTIEHGAYLLLLMIAWRGDGSLPVESKILARYAKVTMGQWRRMETTLRAFFEVENGRLIQKRLRDEFNVVRQRRESQAANGRASALKRKGRHSTKREPNVNQLSTPTPTPTTLAKANGASANSDKVFWDAAVAYLGAGKRSVIGKWCKTYGQPETARAITAAQIERAVDPIAYITAALRSGGGDYGGVPIC
jgi:uncharacterized protein YdaU (DUF1376 family)